MQLMQDVGIKTFQFYWVGGKLEQSEGISIADAFNRAGYGGGSINALDFYEESENPRWRYDSAARKWVRKEISRVK